MPSVTRASIDGLVHKLGLPEQGDYNQDWEYEIASADIAVQLLMDYTQRDDLTDDEKFTLMHTILESINDFISAQASDFPLMDLFKTIVSQDYALHKETFDYWACWELVLEDAFTITPIIREIIIANK